MESMNEKIVRSIQKGTLLELPVGKNGDVQTFPMFIVDDKYPISEFMTFFQVKLHGLSTKPRVIVMQSGASFEVYSVSVIHDDLSVECLYEFPKLLNERKAYSRTDEDDELLRLTRNECYIAYPGSATNQRFLSLSGLMKFFSNEGFILNGYTREMAISINMERCDNK